MRVRLAVLTALSLPLLFACPSRAQQTDPRVSAADGAYDAKPCQASPAPTVEVHFSMAADKAVLGEPLILKFRITNTSPNAVTINLGKDRLEWLSVDMRTSDGKPVSVRKDRRPERQGGIYATPLGRISPGGFIEDEWVVNRRFLLGKEGKYVLTPHPSFSGSSNVAPISALRIVGGPFKITVQKSGPQVLVDISRKIVERLRSGKLTYPQTLVEVDALFSMPPDVAKAAWLDVATGPETSSALHSYAIPYLLLSDTVEAADVLAQIWANPSENSRVRNSAIQALLHLYEAKDPTLKKRIEAIFIAQIGKRPDPSMKTTVSD